MTKSQRNGSVELLRFLFTTIIIFFHINLYIADDSFHFVYQFSLFYVFNQPRVFPGLLV